VRHVHGEEDPKAVDLQPKMQKNQNSDATPVQPPNEATLTVKYAGEGPRSGSTPNQRSSTLKKKSPKQKDQKGDRHFPPH
jgi:hypothetical protein